MAGRCWIQYARGYAQHLFFAHNDYRQVWTGDREILTLDPLFGSFTGSGLIAVSNVTKAKDVSRESILVTSGRSRETDGRKA